MSDRPWLSAYPHGVPADIDPGQYTSLVALMEESFQKYASRTAYSFMGKDISYAQTDSLSRALAAYLQGLGLAKGDRVAIMMPNVPQYPVAVAAILRAGLCHGQCQSAVHPARAGAPAQGLWRQGHRHHGELRHARWNNASPQRRSSTSFCAPWATSWACSRASLVNYVVRNVKKMVPAFSLPGAVRFNEAIAQGTRGTLSRSPTSRPMTWRCCSTPAAPRVCPRAPSCCTAM